MELESTSTIVELLPELLALVELILELQLKILELPIIVQCALGLFSFWSIFMFGRILSRIPMNKIKMNNEPVRFWGESARNAFSEGNFPLHQIIVSLSLFIVHYIIS